MRAEVVAVGNELLSGDVVNGNAAWLGARLTELGVEVGRAVAVPDEVPAIAGAISDALGRAGLVVLTGGLGPTQDDLTREAIAEALRAPLRRDPDLEAALARRFAAAGRVVPERNYRQADLPAGARPLPNPAGTAPGIAAESGSGLVVALPGPPHELRAVFEGAVPELLASRPGGQVIVRRLLRTAGMWESAVAEALGPEVARVAAAGNPRIAFLASEGQTRIQLTARAASVEEARFLLAPVEEFARSVLGRALYGADEDTLEAVTLDLLRKAGATLACAESLTGGLLTARLTAVPGASEVVLGGVVAYATAVKAAEVEVPPEVLERDGAVSAATARAMAVGVRGRFAATYGVALTGVAGPDEQEGKPPGTVHVAVSGPAGEREAALRLPGDRERVRTYAAVAATDRLRRTLLGESRPLGWLPVTRPVGRAGPGRPRGGSVGSHRRLRPAAGGSGGEGGMPLVRTALGDTLRRRRVGQRRTLRDVSRAARVSLGYLSEVERGQKEASSELLAAICAALAVPLSAVLREVSETLAALETAAPSPVVLTPARRSREPVDRAA